MRKLKKNVAWAMHEHQHILDDATEQGNIDDIITATDYVHKTYYTGKREI